MTFQASIRHPSGIPPDEAEFYAAQDKAVKKLAKEQQRQEGLLLEDALRLLKKDRINLDDISETFLYRKLLVAAWSTSATERQWATQQLMGLKGLKVRARDRKTSAEDDQRLDELELLKPG